MISLCDNFPVPNKKGFPSSSIGKESACNAEDPGSIPGLGRSSGAGIGYPLQYSWASMVAKLVKNLPAMQKTWVRSLEKGTATHSSILSWRIPWSPWGLKESDMTFTFTFSCAKLTAFAWFINYFNGTHEENTLFGRCNSLTSLLASWRSGDALVRDLKHFSIHFKAEKLLRPV